MKYDPEQHSDVFFSRVFYGIPIQNWSEAYVFAYGTRGAENPYDCNIVKNKIVS